jgi:hypothetical protein
MSDKIDINFYYLFDNTDFFIFINDFAQKYQYYVKLHLINYNPYMDTNPKKISGLPFITFSQKNRDLCEYDVLGEDTERFIRSVNLIMQ